MPKKKTSAGPMSHLDSLLGGKARAQKHQREQTKLLLKTASLKKWGKK